MEKSKITNVVVGDVDTSDYPKFTDAYIDSAEYEGVPLTEEQCDELTNDYKFVQEHVQEQLSALGDYLYNLSKDE